MEANVNNLDISGPMQYFEVLLGTLVSITWYISSINGVKSYDLRQVRGTLVLEEFFSDFCPQFNQNS